MALQPCRSGLARSSKRAARSLQQCLSARSFATDAPTTTSTTTASSSSSPFNRRPQADRHEHGDNVPRWSRTPPAMKGAVQMDFAKNPANKIWHVNSNPELLDDMYNRLLGPGGSRMLPDELKWLAVTHKSFDQGRRGFNDRLALMGRFTLTMEATKDIVTKPPYKEARTEDEFQREPFSHEQLLPVDNLLVEGPNDVAGKDQLYELARAVGMMDAVRWKPRLPNNLAGSGVEVVMAGALMAIIGAINLQHGADVASKVVRQRILAKMQKRR